MIYKPKFISFDCYGTLINFEMGPTAKSIFEDRVPANRMPAFLDSFRYYRLDEVLGEWKPFFDVIEIPFNGRARRTALNIVHPMRSRCTTPSPHGSPIRT